MRIAVLNTPCALGAGALFSMSLASFLGGSLGAILPMILLAVITLSFASEAYSASRDLRATPVAMPGEVRRTRSRGSLMWFFRSHYRLVDKVVFTVSPVTSLSVQPGDTVEVEHWPYSKTVIRVHMVSQAHRELPQRQDNTRRLPGRDR